MFSLAAFSSALLQICASYCATIPGSEYMGLQFAFECFCGGSSADFDKHGPSDECNLPCVGKQAVKFFLCVCEASRMMCACLLPGGECVV